MFHSQLNQDMHSKTCYQNRLFFLDLSVNVKYALLVLLDLVNQTSTSINEIATKYFIPKSHLELICADLQKGGLIDSNLNFQGSYALKRHPCEITLLDVVLSIESKQNQANSCEVYSPDRKLIHKIWQEARVAAQNTLQQYTLQDLFQKENTYSFLP